jgi:trimeric autotransporter adhesin
VELSGTNLAGAAYRNFLAFPTTFTGGVFVAAGDTDGDGRADVIVGTNAALNYDSRVRVYSGLNNAILKDFIAFVGYRGGVRVAADDLDGDGKADIILSAGRYSSSIGAQPRLLALKGTNLARLQDLPLLDLAFQGGVFVG